MRCSQIFADSALARRRPQGTAMVLGANCVYFLVPKLGSDPGNCACLISSEACRGGVPHVSVKASLFPRRPQRFKVVAISGVTFNNVEHTFENMRQFTENILRKFVIIQ